MSDTSLYDSVDFDTFYLRYLELHRRPATRRLHAIGTCTAACLGLAGLLTGHLWLLVVAPVADYCIAQLSHRLIEGNATQPFRRPLWHVRAELCMFSDTLRDGLALGRGGEP